MLTTVPYLAISIRLVD